MIPIALAAASLAAEVDSQTCWQLGHLGRPLQTAWFEEPNADPWPGLTLGADTAAWTRLSRLLDVGRLPHSGTVRAEELLQALDQDAAPPPEGQPFVLRAELAHSPWEEDAALVRLTVTARRGDTLSRPPATVVLVVDEVVSDPASLSTAREAARELVRGLRPDDTVALIRSGRRGVALPPTRTELRADLDAALADIEGAATGDLPAALGAGWRLLRDAPDGRLRRMMVLSDGDLALITRSDALVRAAAHFAAQGIGLVGLGFGERHERDDSLEGVVRAAGGSTLHLARVSDGTLLADRIGSLLEPAATDLRLLAEWNPDRVLAVHRVGHHFDRLTGLGPTGEPVGGELGVGQTATVLYEVLLAPGSSGSLGTVSARGTEPGGAARLAQASLAGPLRPLEDASPDMKVVVAAAALAEVLADAQPHDRVPPEQVAALAREAVRPEYPRDLELAELAERAVELFPLREACRAQREGAFR